jgi:DNA repair exonuclease SbcCD ATPase subunit
MTSPIPPVENPQTITVPVPAPPATEQVFSAADLERVRQQEKDKLYKELDALREQTSTLPTVTAELEALRKEREERAAREAAAQSQAQEEAKAKAEAEMSAKELLEQRQAEWQAKLDQIQRERETERAALDKEREFAALRDYTQSRVDQERGAIAPELLDLVDGNTPEEIDASIERLKAKSAAIAEKVRGSQQQMAAQQRGVSPAGFSTTGPMDMLPTTQTYTAEDIAKMPLKEYVAKVRGNFIRGDQNSRGLFG